MGKVNTDNCGDKTKYQLLGNNGSFNWRSVQEVQTFVAEHELTVPVLLGTAHTAESYHIKGFPTYYVLNDTGHVIERSLGYSTELGLRWRT